MTNEQLIEWAEKIPMDELFDEIRRLTGLPDLKFTSKVEENRNSVRILFESQDLVEKVGFLKLMFSEIHIANFNSEVKQRKNEDDELEPYYWGIASFRYTHPSGGYNGHNFMYFWYNDKKGWKFD